MYDELNFRESRLTVKTWAAVGAVSAALYAGITYFGPGVLLGFAGLTVGYLVARCTKL